MSAARPAKAAAATAGFTLLETLVALSLAALLIGAVLQSVRWVSTVSGFGNRVAQVATLDAGATALTDLLATAVITNQPAPPFVGDERGFAFDTVSDGTVKAPGHVRVTIAPRRGAGGRIELAAAFTPLNGDGATATTALFDNLVSARVSYFGQDDARAAKTWRKDWTNRNVLPALLLLELESNVDGSIVKLPLYARVGRQSGIFAGRN